MERPWEDEPSPTPVGAWTGCVIDEYARPYLRRLWADHMRGKNPAEAPTHVYLDPALFDAVKREVFANERMTSKPPRGLNDDALPFKCAWLMPDETLRNGDVRWEGGL